MSATPPTSLAVLEGDLARALRGQAAHGGHCKADGPGCDRCWHYACRVDNAAARIAAATSQLPDRCIGVGGALDRRRERDQADA